MIKIDLSPARLLQMQKEQHKHDKRNHCDIHNRHKGDRLKHYALHFSKYVGRLARGFSEEKSVDATLIDFTLVCLSAANTLGQKLGDRAPGAIGNNYFYFLADAVGRFADASEKFDHLEDVNTQAKVANADIFDWIRFVAQRDNVDLHGLIGERRLMLAARAFYAQD